MEYHNNGGKLVEVQKKLGHKSILNPMIYINLEQALFDVSDDFIVKVASSIEQATKLVEVDFEYVTDMDGKKLFRKRK